MTPGTNNPAEPLRMRANWKTVESQCLTCHNAFAFGEEVCACAQCGGYHHARCWDVSIGCSHGAAMFDPAAPQYAAPQYAAPQYPPPPPPPPPAPYAQMPPPPPPPLAQAGPAADEQYCPGCRGIVKIGALRCRFCNYSFSYMAGMPAPMMMMNQPPPMAPPFGGFPYGGVPANDPYAASLQFDLDERSSGARTCGLISILCLTSIVVIILLCAAADARARTMEVIAPILGIILIAALVLGIIAIVRGHGAKRTLERFPLELRMRGKATAGIVMGWITIGTFAFLLIAGLVGLSQRYR